MEIDCFFTFDSTVIGYYQHLEWLGLLIFLKRPQQKFPIGGNVTDDGKTILYYYLVYIGRLVKPLETIDY